MLNQSPASSAQRQPNRHFTLARHAAREHHIGQVHTRQKQHHTNGRQQQIEGLLEVPVDDDRGVRLDRDTPPFVAFRMIGREPSADCLHLGTGALERDPGLQQTERSPRQTEEPVIGPNHSLSIERERQPELHPGPIERAVGRHDADDGERLRVESDRSADQGWVRSKLR